MNLIGNNCLASRIYKINNIQFNNPFIWCSIKFSDFIEIIKNFNNINFNNIEVKFNECKRTNNLSPVIRCDNLFDVHYIHYIEDEKCITPIHKPSKGQVDLFYYDILSYAKNKWFERLNRMSEKPIFIYSFNYRYKTLESYNNASEQDIQTYKNQVKQLYDISKEFNQKIYVIIHKNIVYDEYKDLQNKNFILITPPHTFMCEDKENFWNYVNKYIIECK